MSLVQVAKEKVVAHAAELLIAAAGTVVPAYLFLAEETLTRVLRQVPPEWIVRAAAILVFLVLWLVAWIIFRRPKLRFIEETGVYFDVKTRLHVCPRCRAEKKHSLLKNEERGFRCMVCRYYYDDPKRKAPVEPQKNLGPHGWMAR